ncbi:hypothetical protein HDU97_001839 [Phlyctochytrium planicorne]|nr:hypothetical protein HDU97_001839 [Phlyctochytrium planicorne]
MPKYYCDYCDIFLTHDSPSVRKAHNAGWKHKMHVQNYFTNLSQDKVQDVINQITKAYEGKHGAPDFYGTMNPMMPMMPPFMPPFMRPGMPMPPPGMFPPRPPFPGGPMGTYKTRVID